MDSKNKKDIRICIIGGGPAGMSAAMYLEKNGYDNYQIYEKDNRVGGKCLSPMMKVIDKDGKETMRSFEMGALIMPFMNAKNSVELLMKMVQKWDVFSKTLMEVI